LSSTTRAWLRGMRLLKSVKKGEANKDSKITLWCFSVWWRFGNSFWINVSISFVSSNNFGVSFVYSLFNSLLSRMRTKAIHASTSSCSIVIRTKAPRKLIPWVYPTSGYNNE